MGLISPAQVTDGSTADASDVNSPINTIANEFNGNIDNANIKSAAAISGSKLADNSVDLGAKTSTWDGWILVSDTWTYATATTVTVPSDATTKYSVGDKIKFSNGSTKYFYITAVSATTLTLNGGSDYTVANSAITLVYFSKAETPLSFPRWFNYTATWANLTDGSATKTARFSMSGKTVNFKAGWVYGAGSAVGSSPTVTLPTTAATLSALEPIGTVVLNDASASKYMSTLNYATTTTATITYQDSAGTYAIFGSPTATVPFTWVATDAIYVRGSYETA